MKRKVNQFRIISAIKEDANGHQTQIPDAKTILVEWVNLDNYCIPMVTFPISKRNEKEIGFVRTDAFISQLKELDKDADFAVGDDDGHGAEAILRVRDGGINRTELYLRSGSHHYVYLIEGMIKIDDVALHLKPKNVA